METTIENNHQEIERKDFENLCNYVKARYPKPVTIEHTEQGIMVRQQGGLLFKKDHYNEFCYVRINPAGKAFEMSLFSCDWKGFDKIEGAYAEASISFNITTLVEAKTILTSLV